MPLFVVRDEKRLPRTDARVVWREPGLLDRLLTLRDPAHERVTVRPVMKREYRYEIRVTGEAWWHYGGTDDARRCTYWMLLHKAQKRRLETIVVPLLTNKPGFMVDDAAVRQDAEAIRQYLLRQARMNRPDLCVWLLLPEGTPSVRDRELLAASADGVSGRITNSQSERVARMAGDTLPAVLMGDTQPQDAVGSSAASLSAPQDGSLPDPEAEREFWNGLHEQLEMRAGNEVHGQDDSGVPLYAGEPEEMQTLPDGFPEAQYQRLSGAGEQGEGAVRYEHSMPVPEVKNLWMPEEAAGKEPKLPIWYDEKRLPAWRKTKSRKSEFRFQKPAKRGTKDEIPSAVAGESFPLKKSGQGMAARDVVETTGGWNFPELRPEFRAQTQSSDGGYDELEAMLETLEENFHGMLFRLIGEKQLEEVDCYSRANLDRKAFSKIRKNVDCRPLKTTVAAFCIAMELDWETACELLAKAGYSMTRTNAFDVIVKFCIERGICDVLTVNDLLYDHNQPLLGSGFREN